MPMKRKATVKKITPRKRITRRKKVAKKATKIISVPTETKMISYISSKPMPPNYRCAFKYNNTGIIPANTTNGNLWVCKMNDPIFPMQKNGSFGYSGFYAPTKALNTLEPSAVSAFFNNIQYKYFRVNWSKLSVRFIPQDTGDSVAVCIIPFNSTSNLPTALTYDWAEQQDGAVTKIFTNANCTGWLTNKGTVAKLAGVDPKAIEYDLSGVYNGSYSASPTALCYWYVFYKFFSSVQNISQVGIELKGTYIVDCYTYATMNMPET